MSVYDISGNVLTGDVSIMPYYVGEMEDTVAKVQREINEPCLVFPVSTDNHIGSNAPQNFSKMAANIARFTELVKCDFVACLGDLIDGSSSQTVSMKYALDATKSLREPLAPYVGVQGNHDNNIYSGTSSDKFDIYQVFMGLFNSTRKVLANPDENGTDYYFDTDVGIRVIVLNACNVKRATDYAYGSTTAAWLQDALNTTKTVLLLEHLSSISSQVWNNNSPTGYSGITSAINSFIGNGGKLVQLSGHSHVDLAFITPWMSVMFVCQKCQQANISTTEMQKISGYIDVMGSPARTAGTATEDAWTVCVLKPNSMELSTIRFGAGVDRYFHYNPIAPTTLTSKLTSPTWSSSNESVATVSGGVVTGVASGTCAILAKDTAGNYEAWIVTVS